MVGIIERLEQIVRERGRLPRCELTEYLTMCFSYYDEKDPTIIGMIRRACEDKGISLKCEKGILALVNVLKGNKID
jgi:hypothetical protein